MTAITQSVPTYTGGISQQPDEKKFPGQVVDVVNAIPDATNGLYKRPGAERVGTGKLASVATGGSFFHYYRDEEEGSYIGQVDSNGALKIWKASGDNAGAAQTIAYGTGGETAIKAYLASATPEDIQFLSINDTTFASNRSKPVLHSGTTDGASDTHYAFVEILRTENGRQYSLNAYSGEGTTSISRATRVKISSDTLDESGGTGPCPGIGTQVFSVNSGSKKNLIFRITTLGQQGQLSGYGDDTDTPGPPTESFSCTYNRRVQLLHGGEGWATGDTDGALTVTLTAAKTNYNYTIGIEDSETVPVKADIKAVRPAPTPFDSDTAVTIDTIIGGIVTELSGTAITCTVIGNGIYMTSGSAFQIEIVNKDLMRVMQSTVNDVSLLPSQCKDGYVVKVENSQESEKDDYYLKFEGENGKDGTGSWVEVAGPGLVKGFDKSTMPHVIQRTALANQGTSTEIATFTVKQYDYPDRAIGDDTTNPIPTFVSIRSGHPDYDSSNDDRYINKVLFFRNRLAFLSGERIITCQPGTLGAPDFWAKTALAVSASDPIDIASSSMFPSALYDGIDINAGLLVFSSNQQFLLSSDDTILNPDTAKLRSISTYNYNTNIPPISMGVSVGYIDNSGKYSRFNEMLNTAREGEPTVGETSKLVPSLLPKSIDLITNSRENQLVLFGKTGTNTIYGFKYFQIGEKRQQASWFKWQFKNNLKYHFIIDDDYYFLDTNDFLQRISIVQSDDDISIDQDSVNYLLHLDNHVPVTGGVHDIETDITTFTHGTNGAVTDWIDEVTNGSTDLVIIDKEPGSSTRLARYATCTVINNDDFTVPGDWSPRVRSVTVTNGGSGYTSAPTVSIKGNKGAWTASTAYVTGDQVTNNDRLYILTSGNHTSSGSGAPTHYSGTVTTGGGDCLFSGPQATGTASVVDGAVTAVTITDAGSNYHSGATVTFDGGGGSGAAATATASPLSTSPLNIGYLYEYNVKLPRVYSTKLEGNKSVADVNASLVLHRINLNFGKIGLYETTLDRVGKDSYSEVYESSISDEYEVSDAPYLEEYIQTVPVYEKNKNVDITLKSKHPAPATLHSMSWEGDYSPMYYQRV